MGRPKPTFLQNGLRSAGGPKLLKWGLAPRARVKSAKVRPTPYVYYPPPAHVCAPCDPHRAPRVKGRKGCDGESGSRGALGGRVAA
eukprot:scaffold78110_cov58-Phaeocystis_antarctica.AAC.3